MKTACTLIVPEGVLSPSSWRTDKLFSTRTATVFYHWAWMKLIPQPLQGAAGQCNIACKRDAAAPPYLGAPFSSEQQEPSRAGCLFWLPACKSQPQDCKLGLSLLQKLSFQACCPDLHSCHTADCLLAIQPQVSLNCESWFIFIGKYQNKVTHS